MQNNKGGAVNNPIPQNTKTINDIIPEGAAPTTTKAAKQLKPELKAAPKPKAPPTVSSRNAPLVQNQSFDAGKLPSPPKGSKQVTIQHESSPQRSKPVAFRANIDRLRNVPDKERDFRHELEIIDRDIAALKAAAPAAIDEQARSMEGANDDLRTKVAELIDMVENVMEKASQIKRKIITHREEP